jgi:hypothetical protein
MGHAITISDLPKFAEATKQIAYKVGQDRFGIMPHQFSVDLDITLPVSYQVIYNGNINLAIKTLPIQPEFDGVLLRALDSVRSCVRGTKIERLVVMQEREKWASTVVPPVIVPDDEIQNNEIEVQFFSKVVIKHRRSGVVISRECLTDSIGLHNLHWETRRALRKVIDDQT